jgi:hypothetical protein
LPDIIRIHDKSLITEQTVDMTKQVIARTWAPGERLTPWVLHDLERIAWILEFRAGELTDEERRVVIEASDRLRKAANLA